MTGAALERLAALSGIEPEYWDIFGNRHRTTPATMAGILAALSLPAEDEKQAGLSLDILRQRLWGRLLPPTVAVRLGGATPSVPVHLDRSGGVVAWTVTFEDGGQRAGTVQVHDMTARDEPEAALVGITIHHLPLPADLSPGYHRIEVAAGGRSATALLIAAPARAWLPDEIAAGGRVWGGACQLYELRRDGDWGIGDFTALGDAAQALGGMGAQFIGINPLHALFPDSPDLNSPYFPSSREFLNPLYLDLPAAAAGLGIDTLDDPATAAEVRHLRSLRLIDYPRVTMRKFEALERLFSAVEAQGMPAELTAFIARGGEALRRFALFQALQERNPSVPWTRWRPELRHPDRKGVAAFAAEHGRRVRFHQFVQWLCARGLGDAAARSSAAGLSIGLYRDLAVGVCPAGADAWCDPESYVLGARFGAPPDAFNPEGQDWGAPPMNPLALRDVGYAPFIRMIRANMAHAGALRIDHVMGLLRLYWVPPGCRPSEGTYVRCPFDDLLAILTLESHRNRCLLVGEDLGTVPDGFRERMSIEQILSYRLFWFERWPSGLFKRPDAYPQGAMATLTTHDLATAHGYWTGADVAAKAEIGLLGEGETPCGAQAAREADKDLVRAALDDQGLGRPDDADQAALALHRFVARTPCALMAVNLSDALGEGEQVNVPGTVAEYPNWRRRLSVSTAELAAHPGLTATARAVSDEGRP